MQWMVIIQDSDKDCKLEQILQHFRVCNLIRQNGYDTIEGMQYMVPYKITFYKAKDIIKRGN